MVVVGLPDDQSIRPAVVDINRLHEQLPDVTEEEVRKISDLSKVLARTAGEVAAAQCSGVGRTDRRPGGGRILPLLLPPEHGDVQVAPGAAHRLVAPVVDEK